jgi:hypothetical protein
MQNGFIEHFYLSYRETVIFEILEEIGTETEK